MDANYYRIRYYEDGDEEDMDDTDVDMYLWMPAAVPSPAKKRRGNHHQSIQRKTTTKASSSNSSSSSNTTFATTPTTTHLWKIWQLDPNEVFQNVSMAGFSQNTILRMADFFLFLLERQSIWHRRAARQSVPWSACPIFQTNCFCNVYRELDRGTAFFHSHVVHDLWKQQHEAYKQQLHHHHNNNHNVASEHVWTRTVLWAAYVYRQMNRVATFQQTGFPTTQTLQRFLEQCDDVRQRTGVLFTGAHQTTNRARYETNLRTVAAGSLLDDVVDDLRNASSLQDSIQVLRRQLPGIGMFLAWQIMCDLRESHCFQEQQWDDVDTYCALGPGAKRTYSFSVWD